MARRRRPRRPAAANQSRREGGQLTRGMLGARGGLGGQADPAIVRQANLPPVGAESASKPDFRELGISGTRIFAGIISDEEVPQLQGYNAYNTYKGMLNDATCSALYKAIELPIRSSRWYIDPPSDKPEDVKMADFIHDNLWQFGTQSFDDVLRLALECLPFGFSWLEIIYQMIDQGPWTGMVGWDSFQWRSQNSKWRWNMDYVDNRRQLVSVTQLAAPFYEQIEIPRNKLMLFVNDLTGDNYDGRSLYRPAWKDYYFREALYRIRAIGLERAYMGVPVASLPLGYSDELAGIAKQIVETIRVDEQVGVVKPEELALEVLQNKLDDTGMSDAITYHNRNILVSSMGQFMDLGQASGTGSWALSNDQSELFLYAITAKANYVSEVINLDPGIPQLIRFNFPVSGRAELPRLQHGDIGQRDLSSWGRTLQAFGAYGFLTPDDPTEDRLRQILDLPERDQTVTPDALLDLVQEVFPISRGLGTQHPGGRVPSPLETAALTAQANIAHAAQGAQQGGQPGGQPGGGSPQGAGQQGTVAGQSAVAASEKFNELNQMMARMRWPKPKGRLTEKQRLAIKASEGLTQMLSDMYDDVKYRDKPERPSERVARNRKPYQVRTASEEARKLAPGEPRTVISRQQAISEKAAQDLAAVMQPSIPLPPFSVE